MATAKTARRMEWTGDPEADRLVSEDSTAMLIGFCLDQQVPVEWAFMGPLRIRERLGTIDAREIAAMDPATVEAAFRQPRAVHRYWGHMARRVHELCRVIADQYDDDAAQIWQDVDDAKELERRFAALP